MKSQIFSMKMDQTVTALIGEPSEYRWFIGGCGLALLIGAGLFFLKTSELSSLAITVVLLIQIVMLGLGAFFLYAALKSVLGAASVECSPRGVFPEIPTEAIVYDGAILFGNLRHKLCNGPDDWTLAARKPDLRWITSFLLLLFPMIVAGVSIALHTSHHISWSLAVVTSTIFVTFPLAAALSMLHWGANHMDRRTASLIIPHNGDDLTLHAPPLRSSNRDEASLSFPTAGDECLVRRIARCKLVAVQVAPWKIRAGSSTHQTSTWAVQGLLVLKDHQEGDSERVPLLQSNDFVGTARLMKRLAELLNTPFLFDADPAGWKAEIKRSRTRPLLHGYESLG